MIGPGSSAPTARAADRHRASCLHGEGNAHDTSFSGRVEAELPSMLRVARSILRSEDLAWDAVQETLLRVWKCGWLPDGPVLKRLTRLSSLHILRCARRRTRHEEIASGLASRRCCEDDPFEKLGREDDGAAIAAAVRTLTVAHRQVYELYELEGVGYAEIASELNVPVGTVRSRLHRARNEMRRQLEAHGASPADHHPC